jgi:hypothetical protein
MKRRPWQPVETAPKGKTVEVQLRSGKLLEAHYAQDLSGEEQPPFQGWFRHVSPSSCAGIETPIRWRELKPLTDQ